MAADSVAVLAIVVGTTFILSPGLVWWLVRKVQRSPGVTRVSVKVYGIQIEVEQSSSTDR